MRTCCPMNLLDVPAQWHEFMTMQGNVKHFLANQTLDLGKDGETGWIDGVGIRF